MSDQRKKGKRKVEARIQCQIDKSKQSVSFVLQSHLDGATKRDEVDHRTPTDDPSKFSNRCFELKMPNFWKRSLHIPVTEAALQEIFQMRPKPKGKDAYEKAEEARKMLTFE
ncbi:hypothetical protein AHAS_Ahas13G0251300 [Arachis hypogaea]